MSRHGIGTPRDRGDRQRTCRTQRISYTKDCIRYNRLYQKEAYNLAGSRGTSHYGGGVLTRIQDRTQLPTLGNAYLKRDLIDADREETERRRSETVNV